MTEEVVYLRFIMTGGFSIFGDSIFTTTQRVGNFSKKIKKLGYALREQREMKLPQIVVHEIRGIVQNLLLLLFISAILIVYFSMKKSR